MVSGSWIRQGAPSTLSTGALEGRSCGNELWLQRSSRAAANVTYLGRAKTRTNRRLQSLADGGQAAAQTGARQNLLAGGLPAAPGSEGVKSCTEEEIVRSSR